MDDRTLLRTAADRLLALAARTTAGDWRLQGLLATRPEVVAHGPDGGTAHVAEARAGTGAWIAALSPELADPLARWLGAAADDDPVPAEAVAVAAVLVHRLPGGSPGPPSPGPHPTGAGRRAEPGTPPSRRATA